MSRRKIKKPNPSRQKKKKWAAMSKALREEQPHCSVCSRRDHLQVHHLLEKKVYPDFRFIKENLIVLCPSHHTFGAKSAHRGPFWFSRWLMKYRPQQYQWVMDHVDQMPMSKKVLRKLQKNKGTGIATVEEVK